MFWAAKPPPPPPVERFFGEFSPVVQGFIAMCDQLRSAINTRASGYEAWQLLLIGSLVAYILQRVITAVLSARRTFVDKGFQQLVAGFLLDLPGLRGFVAKHQAATVAKLRASLQKKGKDDPTLLILPKQGLSAAQVTQQLAHKSRNDLKFAEGESKASGAVYLAGTAHQLLLNQIYSQFSITNPMHSDMFPSVRQMEGEVVAMTASLLGGGPTGDPEVCGAMTSGGTESILTAVKAARDYMAATRGITQPEMIIAVSAHAAFIKAAEYFKITAVKLPVGADYRLSAKAVKRAITKNTVLVVASSPGFPHGVMDHVEDIAEVARKKGVLCHVDSCLGGFVLPFARDLGYHVPPFDFSVPGVTSISVGAFAF